MEFKTNAFLYFISRTRKGYIFSFGLECFSTILLYHRNIRVLWRAVSLLLGFYSIFVATASTQVLSLAQVVRNYSAGTGISSLL